MNAYNGLTLIQAILLIEGTIQSPVTMIEYEDGSGFKFNYSTIAEPKRAYIDLSHLKK